MKIIKAKDGESLHSLLSRAEKNAIIELEPHIYREKVIIETDGLTIKGVAGKTKIVFGDYAKKIHTGGKEFNTFRTYTVQVVAKNVTMLDLEIENDSYDPEEKGQAVALSVYADGFYGKNLILKSAQDTLFLGPLPDDLIVRYIDFLPDRERYAEGEFSAAFEDSKIFGSVDYVFGCAKADFFNCNFTNINDNRAIGYVCAPAHSLKQSQGFTFFKCNFQVANDCRAQVFLARPWRDFGKCTFIDCALSNGFSPLGFDPWNDTRRDLTARFEFFGTPIKSPVPWARELKKEEADEKISTLKKELEKFHSR